MKNILLIVFLIFLTYAGYTQIPQYEWSFTTGSNSSDKANAMGIDAQGNKYVCGFFRGAVDFEPGPGSTTISTYPNTDVFVMKLDTNDNLVWVKEIQSNYYSEYAYNLAVDDTGNVYVSGIFSTSIDLDPGQSNHFVSSSGGFDVFLVKLDANGSFLWGSAFGGADHDYDGDIEIDDDGNVLLLGSFLGSMDCDPGAGTFMLHAQNASKDGFIIKLCLEGNFIWAKKMSGAGEEYCRTCATDSYGNIYLSGYFESTIDIDPGPAVHLVSSFGGKDSYLLKLDMNGNMIWANTYGGINDETGAVLVEKNNSLYLAASHHGSYTIAVPGGIDTLSSLGELDVTVIKMDTSGQYLWTYQTGGASYDVAYDILLDSDENIYITGGFNDTVDFNPGPGIDLHISNGNYDSFISKIDSSGNHIWTTSYGGQNVEVSISSAITGVDFYTVGFFQGITDLDPHWHSQYHSSYGNNDIMMLKLDLEGFLDPYFHAIQTSITLADTVQFIEQSYGSPTSWFWDFGDGTTSSSQQAAHHYVSGGEFTVSLVIANTGGTDTLVKTNYINVESNLTVNVVSNNVSCHNGTDGSLALSVTTGNTPYTYNWSNGSQNDEINNLGAGFYSVTVLDPYYMSFIDSFVISQPDPLLILASLTDSICLGSIDIVVSGGTSPFTFQWSNGSTTEDLYGIAAGTFTLELSDANSCALGDTFMISNAALPLHIDLNPVHISCDEFSDGEIDAHISGGFPDSVFFSWSNGSNTEDISGLPAGVYTLTATQTTYQCSDIQTITLLEPDTILLIEQVVNDSCFATPGSIDLIVSGGTSPYSYSWSNGDTLEQISNLQTGYYTVSLTDNQNCFFVDSFLINLPPIPFSLDFIVTNVTCNGLSNGEIESIVTGGFPDTLEYSWSNGFTSADMENLATGTYLLNVQQPNNACWLESSVTITMPDQLLPNGNTIPVLCYGENSGSISLSPTGGTPPFDYYWSNGSNDAANLNLAAANYMVTIIDDNSCIENFAFSITQANLLYIDAIIVNNTSTSNPNGSIDIIYHGGTQPYDYNWSNGAGTPDITALEAGSYTLNLTDHNACTLDSTFTILDLSGIEGRGNSDKIQLYQNHPNPFITETTIAYKLAKSSTVKISIYNLSGEQLLILEDGMQEEGKHFLNFKNSKLPSGTYFYKLKTQDGEQSRKMIIMD